VHLLGALGQSVARGEVATERLRVEEGDEGNDRNRQPAEEEPATRQPVAGTTLWTVTGHLVGLSPQNGPVLVIRAMSPRPDALGDHNQRPPEPGFAPAGGSLPPKSSKHGPPGAAPETCASQGRAQGGGPRGNQGFPREASAAKLRYARSTLITFVVPGRFTAVPAVITTRSPGETRPLARAASVECAQRSSTSFAS
jgi:hypothetical protein